MRAGAFFKRQSSNVGLGMLAVWALCQFVFVVGGEFPVRAHAVAAIAISYVIVAAFFEVKLSLSSIEDFIFFSVYGSAGTIFAFREIDAGSSSLSVDVTGPAPIVAAFISHMIIRSLIIKSRRNPK